MTVGTAGHLGRRPLSDQAATVPPPAPGPMSTIQSAARSVPSSCSTTTTLLPRSPRRLRAPSRRSWSRLQADLRARRGRRAPHEACVGEPRAGSSRLSAAEGVGSAIEREAPEPHLEEELEATSDLSQDICADPLLAAREREIREPRGGARRQPRQLGEPSPPEAYGSCAPRRCAVRRTPDRSRRRGTSPPSYGRAQARAPSKEGSTSLYRRCRSRCPEGRCGPRDRSGTRSSPPPWRITRRAPSRAHAKESRGRIRAPPRPAPRRRTRPWGTAAPSGRSRDAQGPLADAQVRIGDHRALTGLPKGSVPLAGWTGADRGVEGEEARLERRHVFLHTRDRCAGSRAGEPRRRRRGAGHRPSRSRHCWTDSRRRPTCSGIGPQSIHDHLDVVHLVAPEFRNVLEAMDRAIDARPNEPRATQIVQHGRGCPSSGGRQERSEHDRVSQIAPRISSTTSRGSSGPACRNLRKGAILPARAKRMRR